MLVARTFDMVVGLPHTHSPRPPTPVVGFILKGDPQVLINGMPAARVNDMGMHAACEGANMFQIGQAKSGVMSSGMKLATMFDQTKHCGTFPGFVMLGSFNTMAPPGGGGGGGGGAGGAGEGGAAAAASPSSIDQKLGIDPKAKADAVEAGVKGATRGMSSTSSGSNETGTAAAPGSSGTASNAGGRAGSPGKAGGGTALAGSQGDRGFTGGGGGSSGSPGGGANATPAAAGSVPKPSGGGTGGIDEPRDPSKRKVVILANPGPVDSNLPGAYAEGGELANLLKNNAKLQVQLKRSSQQNGFYVTSKQEVGQKMMDDCYIFHIASHGVLVGDEGKLCLAQDQSKWFGPSDVTKAPQALVYADCCETLKGDVEKLGKTFVQKGAHHYLGFNVKIDDAKAVAMCKEFYSTWLNTHGGDPKKVPDAFNSIKAKYDDLKPQLISNDSPPAIPEPKTAADSKFAPKDEDAKYDFYRKVIESKGVFTETAMDMNVLGIRGWLEGKKVENVKDAYNDTLVIVWVDQSGKKNVREFVASTDPGKFSKYYNEKGDANLCDGQYDYKVGTHKGYTAMNQAAEVTIWRDKEKDGVRQADTSVEEKGWFGINMHAAGTGTKVGEWSAGCQVIKGGKTGEPFQTFIGLLQKDPDQKIKYTLIDGSQMPSA